MTPESQRIAIAEACGWARPVDLRPPPHNDDQWWTKGDNKLTRHLPDYLGDLNAMHEAEKVRWMGDLNRLYNDAKTYAEWNRYQELLHSNVHATSAQRSEQFLRTLNLWVEEPVSEATVEGLR